MPLATPHYLIDENALDRNLAKVDRLRALSGAKCVFALKAFATWSTFAQIAPHMDGSTSSSLNEVKLGREKFGGETHAYSVAWSDDEIDEAIANADKVIFNSISQFERYAAKAAHLPIGIRVNPGISHSHFDLADPARPFSRLGERDPQRIESVMDRASGFMIHCNCENDSFESFSALLDQFEAKLGHFFERLDWVSFGGGLHFTGEGYALEALAARLKAFAERYRLQVYLEPGDAVVTQTTTLEVSVLDIVDNEKQIAIVDSAVEAHMLDLLVYRETAHVEPDAGPHRYVIAGKSCLAGDVFGEFDFPEALKVGDRISLLNAGGYTMVKKNWFNGVNMPAIAIRRKNGDVELVRSFDYADYVASLS
ncbi:carboxynorspermidine decarboxylase [Devosia sp. 63-57]|uniref:carboxynorspermidine decarboxylase n=1 Tax=Devosia sp. 63-57 TaxID=1895751 RepID=UPI000868C3C0|nr:carboxynorspermidine decarboxylase [Devosia sp. 63-57]ODT50615.1 MAG: carboxynorspermidine decarboxylase [Pelagibacterium sp. SCN 63-126]ODU85218.1 MAG: carboxynorspermidine decarboxylase [Pelagibacterium sp. SCN 63-17]OJX45437.1 MAG: carboxynorspermidine decarboxylase [Devosia sp. 63-57]